MSTATNHTTKHRNPGQPLVRIGAPPSAPDVLARNLRESARTIAYMVEDMGPRLTQASRVEIEAAVKRAIGAMNAVAEAVAHA